MTRPEGLYKTTVVIWTEFEPSGLEIDDLAREAIVGEAFCSEQSVVYVQDESQFPDTEFFGDDE